MLDKAPDSSQRPWDIEGDVLLLFTDGIADARNRFDQRLDEAPVLEVVKRHRTETPAQIASRVFEAVR